MTGFRLADRCPRLALARDQHNAEVRAGRARERHLRSERHRLAALVAHRELQLQRAFVTRDGRYIVKRQRKLAEARRRLARLEKAV